MTPANNEFTGEVSLPRIKSDSFIELPRNKSIPGCISARRTVGRIFAPRCLDHFDEASMAPGTSLLRALGSYSVAARAAKSGSMRGDEAQLISVGFAGPYSRLTMRRYLTLAWGVLIEHDGNWLFAQRWDTRPGQRKILSYASSPESQCS